MKLISYSPNNLSNNFKSAGGGWERGGGISCAVRPGHPSSVKTPKTVTVRVKSK